MIHDRTARPATGRRTSARSRVLVGLAVVGAMLVAGVSRLHAGPSEPSLLPEIDPQRIDGERAAQAALDAVAREQGRWAYQLRERERACFDRWLINACLADVREDRQRVERRFGDIEVAANEVLRRERNLERNREEAKRLAADRRGVEVALPPPVVPAAPAATDGEGRVSRAVRGPQAVRDEQDRRKQALRDRQQRLSDHEARQREVRQREARAAERAAEREKTRIENEQRARERAEAASRRREDAIKRAGEREAEAARDVQRRDRRAAPTQ